MPANIYKLKDATIAPGVTTITGQYPKGESFLDWVWNCGKKKKPWREERDSAGDIGTLVHAMVMACWKGTFDGRGNLIDLGYSLKQIDIANICVNKFADWKLKQVVTPALIEEPLVSERFKFGGTPDLYAKVNGKNRLIDVKTSGGIYEAHWLQLAGYGILLEENGYPVDEYQILWLPKDDRFDAPIRTDLTKEKKIFKSLLNIWKLRRE